MLGSLRHPIGKAGSATSSEDAFLIVSFSAKKQKLFINDSESKGNESNVVTG